MPRFCCFYCQSLLGGPDAKEWLRQCGNVFALLSIAEDFATGSLAWEVSKEVVDIYHQVCVSTQRSAQLETQDVADGGFGALIFHGSYRESVALWSVFGGRGGGGGVFPLLMKLVDVFPQSLHMSSACVFSPPLPSPL